MAAGEPSRKKIRASRVWVPVILATSILIGFVLAETIPSPPVCPVGYSCPPQYFYLLSVQRALMLHVMLSTIELILLVSLVAVYAKVYAATRASFSLGLTIVFVVLTMHSFLSHPLVVNQVRPVLSGAGLFFPYIDFLTIIAYSVFLYLSLE
jgi:hypothetical protein